MMKCAFSPLPMMFNGSKNYKPTEFDKNLENGGGYSNAASGLSTTGSP